MAKSVKPSPSTSPVASDQPKPSSVSPLRTSCSVVASNSSGDAAPVRPGSKASRNSRQRMAKSSARRGV
jgi:hypothetical protein